MDKRLADKELRVLLNDIVENASGTRSLFIGFGHVAAGVQKRYASRLLDSAEATLGEQKGLAATIERADLDQLQLNPKARWRRSRLFMMHMPFDYYVAEATGSEFGGKPPHKYRVLLLVEYTNTPEDFDAQYPDFLRLMGEVHVLTDAMLLEYMGDSLAKCGDKAKPAVMSVFVSPLGNGTVKGVKELEPLCASKVATTYRFGGTGQGHDVERNYDFAKPLKPAWLTAGAYTEQRAPEKPAEAAKPDETTTEGTDQPEGADKTAPAAPTDPPAGGATPPPSNAKAAPRAASPAPAPDAPKAKP